MADRRLTAFVGEGTARLLWVEATDTAAELVARHALEGRAATLSAELVVASLLLGAYVKGEERMQLQLQASAPDVSFFGEVDAHGSFRGRLQPAHVEADGAAVRGMMLAIKSDAQREMYRGVSEVDDETIAHALERHLRSSDQVDARVRIDVAPDLSRVQGLVLDRLPVLGGTGVDADSAARFEDLDALDPDALARAVQDEALLGDDFFVLDTLPVRFRCRCDRGRVGTMLQSLGYTELRAMRDEDAGAEVTCHFCGQVYAFDGRDLDGLLAGMPAEA
ncbi:MAG: Hsp33 family molecular chaperone HslO [Alphaproteobacteria bacterium]|nr:Hsp33 family molecular chaperone HslO [Alphaproteobacteria bacterium]